MLNLPARSLPQHRAQTSHGRTAVRSWLLALLLLASASLLGACLVEDGAAMDDWQDETEESAYAAVTCEPPPPSTDPEVLRRQALEAMTAANRLAIDPATGRPTFQGCLGTSPSSCLWLCNNGNPWDDEPYCDLCCPGCGGGPHDGSGAPTDAFPCSRW